MGCGLETELKCCIVQDSVELDEDGGTQLYTLGRAVDIEGLDGQRPAPDAIRLLKEGDIDGQVVLLSVLSQVIGRGRASRTGPYSGMSFVVTSRSFGNWKADAQRRQWEDHTTALTLMTKTHR